MKRTPRRIAIVTLAVAVAGVVVYFSYARPSSARGAEVKVEVSTKYGPVLVVDGGELNGFPLYEFSGDGPNHLACGTVEKKGYDLDPDGRVTMSCTGPEADILNGVTSDDWPAFTSKGPPIAGRGVDQKLLGTIARKGVGNQVTYAGHPLYLFDPSSSPFEPLGVDYAETTSPLAPWHGYWFLVSARTGAPMGGVATIEVATLPDGERALAVEADPNIEPFADVVYTYSADRRDQSTCRSTCALTWVPLVTLAAPRTTGGVEASAIGTIKLPDGSLQVTYAGHPLYLFSRERVFIKAKGGIVARGTAGNGNGLVVPGGGRFSVVDLSPA